MFSQLRYLFKQSTCALANRKGFVATVISTMSITLGALLCVLTLAYVLVIKPLPYPNQDNLMVVKHHLIDAQKQQDGSAFTYPNLLELYNNQQVFKQSALAFYSDDILLSSEQKLRYSTAYVTPSWFSLFGASLSKGRLFEASEGINSYQPVAIISHDTWQTSFAGAQDIIGQTLTFSDISYRIVGVLGPDFIEPQLQRTGRNSQIYLPWDYNEVSERDRKSWGNDDGRLFYIGELAKPLSTPQINQQLTTLINSNWQDKMAKVDFFNGWSIALEAQSLKSLIIGDAQRSIYLLLAGVLGLLVIACANIANLFLSRMAQQQRTLAIHAALGASHKHLFHIVLSESALLMSASMALAIIIAMFGFSLMQHWLVPYLPRISELGLTSFTMACAALLCVLLSGFFAWLNSRAINYQFLNHNLQSSGKGTGIQISSTVRQLLIISQVCVVTVLVFINMNLLKESLATINKDDGFKVEQLTSVRLSLTEKQRPSFEKRIAMMDEIRQTLLALPQVEAVSQSSSPLASFGIYAMTIKGTQQRFTPQGKGVDHLYFPLIGQRLIAGNNFSAADFKDLTDVVIVNQTMALKLLGDPNNNIDTVLGTQLNFGGDNNVTIIGIVKDASVPGNQRTTGRVYHTTSLGYTRLLLKLTPDSSLSAPQFSELLRGITSQYTLYEILPQAKRRSEILFTQYTTAITSAVLAAITLLLTAIGLYGIVSYSTQMRQFEIGTRQAIGAKRWDIIKLIIVDNSKPFIIGLAISIALLLLMTIAIDSGMLSGFELASLPLFVLTLTLISLIAGFACYWPLRRLINRPAMNNLTAND